MTETLNIHGYAYEYDPATGRIPRFTWEILKRIHKKMATNVAFVGEPGIGKSYMAIQIARVVDPKFTIDQVVFSYSEFMKAVNLPLGRAIVFDEPSYALSHRTWYKEVQQALTRTLESFRFKVHPTFFPIINLNLLDKTVRQHLIQFQVVVTDRGKARVYRLESSHAEDKLYRHHICNLEMPLMDYEVCSRDTCLGCIELSTCNVFRAQYERKKAFIQETRYKHEYEEAKRLESKEFSFKDILRIAYEKRSEYTNPDTKKISAAKLKLALREEGITVGINKAYEVKLALEKQYPNEFMP